MIMNGDLVDCSADYVDGDTQGRVVAIDQLGNCLVYFTDDNEMLVHESLLTAISESTV